MRLPELTADIGSIPPHVLHHDTQCRGRVHDLWGKQLSALCTPSLRSAWRDDRGRGGGEDDAPPAWRVLCIPCHGLQPAAVRAADVLPTAGEAKRVPQRGRAHARIGLSHRSGVRIEHGRLRGGRGRVVPAPAGRGGSGELLGRVDEHQREVDRGSRRPPPRSQAADRCGGTSSPRTRGGSRRTATLQQRRVDVELGLECVRCVERCGREVVKDGR